MSGLIPDDQQLLVFDVKGGEEQKNEGIATAYEHASEEWKIMAWKALEQVARQHEYFQVDEVWLVLDRPVESRAMGGIMKQAQKIQWVEPTDRWIPSRLAHQHRRPLKVWKSLLHKPATI